MVAVARYRMICLAHGNFDLFEKWYVYFRMGIFEYLLSPCFQIHVRIKLKTVKSTESLFVKRQHISNGPGRIVPTSANYVVRYYCSPFIPIENLTYIVLYGVPVNSIIL